MTKAMHRIQRKNKFLPYLLTLPSMLLFSMFTFYPFLKTIALSFFLTDKRGNPTKWAGISNWVRVLSKETFWKIIAITLKIAGINLVFTFGLAIFFALLSSQKKKGGKLYQTMYALPMAIASSPAAAIFLFIFRQKNGVINSLLGGANIGWTTEMPYAMWAVCIMTIWMNVGISYIFLLVGFRAVPQDLIESAYLDGAGVWARIWHVMLPMASPQIFFVLFLNIAISFRSFAQIKLLTGGGPANATKNLIYYIYENAIINGRYETACVQAIFLFGLILLFTSLQFALEKRFVHTTILTGCYPASHGVISNTHFTTGSTEYEWLWDASNVKVLDVITAAKDQGYTTGAVFWPVTGNHKAVDYLIDEYWCPHEGETLLGGFANMGSSPEMLKIIEKNQHLLPNGGKLGRVALMDHPQIDHFLISCACDIIREYSPEFMLVHNGNIDDARHKYGVFNEEVLHGLDLVDLWIGQLMRALEDSGHLHDTDVIIVSDHGQMDLSRVIKPNALLQLAVSTYAMPYGSCARSWGISLPRGICSCKTPARCVVQVS